MTTLRPARGLVAGLAAVALALVALEMALGAHASKEGGPGVIVLLGVFGGGVLMGVAKLLQKAGVQRPDTSGPDAPPGRDG